MPGRGARLIALLAKREGVPTRLDFEDGTSLTTVDNAYGRDIGEEWEHIYIRDSEHTWFVSTSTIVAAFDPTLDAILYQRDSA